MEAQQAIRKLEQAANKLKNEASLVCRQCLKACKQNVVWCSSCCQYAYCSKHCKKVHHSQHKKLCKLITACRGFAGYSDVFHHGAWVKKMVTSHGMRFLTPEQRGAVAFSLYPSRYEEAMEKKTKGSPAWMQIVRHPTKPIILHIYLMKPDECDELVQFGHISTTFRAVLERPGVYRKFIPTIYFNVDPAQHFATIGISYYFCSILE